MAALRMSPLVLISSAMELVSFLWMAQEASLARWDNECRSCRLAPRPNPRSNPMEKISLLSDAAIVSLTKTTATGRPEAAATGGRDVPKFLRTVYAALGVLALVVAIPHFAAAQACGDVNGSGTVTASDALLVLSKAVGIDVQCESGGLLTTGRTEAFGSGSDGDMQAGTPLAYTDNGDGTITDNNTGLMWEKKDDSGASGSIHSRGRAWSWSSGSAAAWHLGGSTRFFLDALNVQRFAGYDDWRLPNVRELYSIVHFGKNNPAVDRVFHQPGCTGCTDVTLTTCSCSASSFYWSSTTIATFPGSAWVVFFSNGNVSGANKTLSRQVRAVRGGL